MSNSIGEMCRLLPRGSRVTLLFEHRPPDFRVLDSRETRGVDLCFRRGKPHDYADLQAALSTSVGGVAGAVDTVVLMPRTDASDDDESGASNALATVVKMGDILRREGRAMPRVVGVCVNEQVEEVLLALYKDLGGERDEIVNPTAMIAGIATQTTMSEGVEQAYRGLLEDKHAPRIQAWLAHHYVTPGAECTFWDVMEAAEALGHVPIGFAREGQDVELNPNKAERITLGPEDKVIVVAP